jgi:hypothetical protein
MIALVTVSACAGGSTTKVAETTTAATTASTAKTAQAFPASANYIADMPMADGNTMTLGVAVDGEKVVAYACDGSDDEAWFFGKQADGKLDITGKFRDTLQAAYDGEGVVGDLTMDGMKYTFDAAPAADPAGIYTTELDGVRASWVVRPDGTTTGVQFGGIPGISGRDFEQAELQQLKGQQFRDRVRNKRLLQQAAQLHARTWQSTINGRPVVAARVRGNTAFG